MLFYRYSNTLLIQKCCSDESSLFGHVSVGWLVGWLQRWADNNVTLAVQDAQVIPPFSREETDNTDDTNDTDYTDDTDDTDETDE